MRLLTTLLVLRTCALSTSGDVVVKNLSTGIDDATGLKIGNDLPEPDYFVFGNAGIQLVARQTPLPGRWMPDREKYAVRTASEAGQRGAWTCPWKGSGGCGRDPVLGAREG